MLSSSQLDLDPDQNSILFLRHDLKSPSTDSAVKQKKTKDTFEYMKLKQ